MDLGNRDLAVLVAYKIKRNWSAALRVTAVLGDESEADAAMGYLETLVETARIPNARLETTTLDGAPELAHRLRASITIGSLPPDPDLARIRRQAGEAGSPCLFALDSGRESALV